ncbi:DUF2269 domain-containing protein [Brevibacillus humidisoli]|uniref:DUF2269 family protein n=1 Tax=Brevibacillus humidisoli TaxID=2895522 RepID=UPI001E5CC36C|nr:DUF2269 family protein [Brevibacillus humidisoli]UFJ40788.1 DUF2269 domain-containing protein [Brevibacillus humidisoli]
MKIAVFLHVLGAILFIGNIATAAFWKIRAERGNDLGHLHRTVRNVMLADFIFTLPGILLVLGSGVFLTLQLGYSLTEVNWLTISLGLFAITGLIWVAILLPSQSAMVRHSREAIDSGQLGPEYRRASRTWDLFGTAATILPLIILYFMTTR